MEWQLTDANDRIQIFVLSIRNNSLVSFHVHSVLDLTCPSLQNFMFRTWPLLPSSRFDHRLVTGSIESTEECVVKQLFVEDYEENAVFLGTRAKKRDW